MVRVIKNAPYIGNGKAMAKTIENTPKVLYSKAEQNKLTYADNLTKCGDKVEAYKMTFPDAKNSTALANAHQYAKHPAIIDEVTSILNTGKITDERVALKLSEMLDANKEYFDNKGILRVVRDNGTQLDTLKTVFRLKGHLSTGTSVDNRSVTVNNTINDVQVEQLASVVESLKAMNAQLVGDSDAQTGRIEDVESIRPVEEK